MIITCVKCENDFLSESDPHLVIPTNEGVELTCYNCVKKEERDIKQQLADKHNENRVIKEELKQVALELKNAKAVNADLLETKRMHKRRLAEKQTECDQIANEKLYSRRKLEEENKKLKAEVDVFKKMHDKLDEIINFKNKKLKERDEWIVEARNLVSALLVVGNTVHTSRKGDEWLSKTNHITGREG